MTTLTLKNIPEALHQGLKRAAERNHRSLNREILLRLETQLHEERLPAQDTLTKIRDLQRRLPQVDHRLVKDFKGQGRP